MTEFVTASRGTEAEFWAGPLGRSRRRLPQDTTAYAVRVQNRRPLADWYNRRLDDSTADVLAFVHDDVWLDDCHVAVRLAEALGRFDVVGVAGCVRRNPGRPGWAFPDDRLEWDDPGNLSGCIAHGPGPCGAVDFRFPTPAACELLDGVFLAAKRQTLLAAGVRFDPRFAFHFYDLDFCRSATTAGLRLGTVAIGAKIS